MPAWAPCVQLTRTSLQGRVLELPPNRHEHVKQTPAARHPVPLLPPGGGPGAGSGLTGHPLLPGGEGCGTSRRVSAIVLLPSLTRDAQRGYLTCDLLNVNFFLNMEGFDRNKLGEQTVSHT